MDVKPGKKRPFKHVWCPHELFLSDIPDPTKWEQELRGWDDMRKITGGTAGSADVEDRGAGGEIARVRDAWWNRDQERMAELNRQIEEDNNRCGWRRHDKE